jgi:hypothetical protein
MLAMLMAVVALASAPVTPAETDAWTPIRFLTGRWRGESEGRPGKGTVERMYRFVLNDRFLAEQNVSTYAPQDANPKGEVHEHLSYFSYDRARKALVFRQFHQESFVIQYVMKPVDGTRVVFESEALENVPANWKARETYEVVSDEEFVETFELAMGDKPYEVYSRSRFRRAP